MVLKRNKLYTLLGTLCLVGYIWLFFSIRNASVFEHSTCLVKNATGFACPSCGSTRAVISLFSGNISEALLWNPLGVLVFIIMIILPHWLGIDLFLKKNSLQRFYHQTELFLQQKKVAIPAVALVLLNWGWNIYKDL